MCGNVLLDIQLKSDQIGIEIYDKLKKYKKLYKLKSDQIGIEMDPFNDLGGHQPKGLNQTKLGLKFLTWLYSLYKPSCLNQTKLGLKSVFTYDISNRVIRLNQTKLGLKFPYFIF